MAEHFVDYIKIKHYKCFDDFSAEGFKRVNLIAGKNNVGKTALLEALLVNISAKNVKTFIWSLYFSIHQRKQIDQTITKRDKALLTSIESICGMMGFFTNLNSVSYRVDESDISKRHEIILNDKSVKITDTNISEVISSEFLLKTAAYISSIRDSQKGIIRSFTAIQKKDRESQVNQIIRSFDDSIENIKVIGGNSIECKVKGVDGNSSYRNLSEFGDGLRHYLSVIADLFATEGSYLFIDEVDNGIHYSSLDNLWEIILTLSKELNVQVFATTHSKECIEAYCRTIEKLKDKDITFTTLVRNKERQVKAIVRDYDVFTDSMNDAREVRGW